MLESLGQDIAEAAGTCVGGLRRDGMNLTVEYSSGHRTAMEAVGDISDGAEAEAPAEVVADKAVSDAGWGIVVQSEE